MGWCHQFGSADMMRWGKTVDLAAHGSGCRTWSWIWSDQSFDSSLKLHWRPKGSLRPNYWKHTLFRTSSPNARVVHFWSSMSLKIDKWITSFPITLHDTPNMLSTVFHWNTQIHPFTFIVSRDYLFVVNPQTSSFYLFFAFIVETELKLGGGWHAVPRFGTMPRYRGPILYQFSYTAARTSSIFKSKYLIVHNELRQASSSICFQSLC